MSRLECILGRHRHAISVIGMTESSVRGKRALAGYRCRCGALVFKKMTTWRGGEGALRALKREVRKGAARG